MTRPPLSQESVHAFVDGEADRSERERAFAACEADEGAARSVAEAQRLKAALRHAYAEVSLPPRAATPVPPRRYGIALAVAFAFAAGWALSSAVAHAPVPVPQQAIARAALPGVVIQVADGDAAKWRLAIDQANAVRQQMAGTAFDVVVIAYGPALAMLEAGSDVQGGVAGASSHGVRFLACGNTMQHESVAVRDLLDRVEVAPEGAMVRVLALQRAGYASIRI